MTPDETRARFPTLVDFIDMIKAEFGPGVKVKYLHNAEAGDTIGKPGDGFVSVLGQRIDSRAVTAPRPQQGRSPSTLDGQ